MSRIGSLDPVIFRSNPNEITLFKGTVASFDVKIAIIGNFVNAKNWIAVQAEL